MGMGGMSNGHPSCMSPRGGGHLPSYMGTSNQYGGVDTSQYGQAAMMTPTTLSPTHAGSMMPAGVPGSPETELRSSSIVALRMKAKEHLTATMSSMNMIGAYS